LIWWYHKPQLQLGRTIHGKIAIRKFGNFTCKSQNHNEHKYEIIKQKENITKQPTKYNKKTPKRLTPSGYSQANQHQISEWGGHTKVKYENYTILVLTMTNRWKWKTNGSPSTGNRQWVSRNLWRRNRPDT